MELNEAIAKFKEVNKLLHAYTHAMGVMYYDIETAAPKNAVMGFGETMAALSEVTYKLSVNEESFALVDFLSEHAFELDEITRREVEETEKSLRNMRRIPMDEYVEYQKVVSMASSVWHEAKVTSNFAMFEPHLEKLVEYARRFAGYMAPEKDPYDFWLNEFEEGFTTDVLDNYFNDIKASLVPLIHEICQLPAIDDSFLGLDYPIDKQRELSDYLMSVMGINRGDCAIGETEHPFTTGFNKHDIRITTHYHINMVASSMYSVIHEGGHATYELNTADELIDSPLAGGASWGMHESQSRFYENIIGRSLAFIELIFPKLTELFPEQLNGVTPYMFYLAVNKATPSLIRTEADELTYSLHVLIRYELEKRLIGGTLAVHDLPAEWNRLYKEYLGVDVPDDKNGVLQDSHWSSGSFGYFPSYSLGSAYGAQIVNSMRKQMDIDALVRTNNIKQIVEWLTEHVYKYGMVKKPNELIRICCNEDFDPAYYTEYLTVKFRKIYEL